MWEWRSKEDAAKLEIAANKAIRNIALFLVLGSLALNLITWLAISMIEIKGIALKNALTFKPLSSALIGMIIAVIYAMWVTNGYQKAMKAFRGGPDEQVCTEQKNKAEQKIGLCGPLCLMGWFISVVAAYL